MSTTKWFSRFFQSRLALVSQLAAKLFPFSVLLCLALSSASATTSNVIGYWDGETSTANNCKRLIIESPDLLLHRSAKEPVPSRTHRH